MAAVRGSTYEGVAGRRRDKALVKIIHDALELQKTAEISFQDKSEEEWYQKLIRAGSEYLKYNTSLCASRILAQYLYDVLCIVQPQEYTLDCGPVEVKEETVIKLERDIDHDGTSDVQSSGKKNSISKHDKQVKREEGNVWYHSTSIKSFSVMRPRQPAVRVLC